MENNQMNKPEQKDEAKKLARELTDATINAIKKYEGSEFLTELAEALYSRKI